MNKHVLDKQTWQAFHESGMLFYANTALQFFGWSIVLSYNEDGTFLDAYPVRSPFRGFTNELTDEGFRKVHNWMEKNIQFVKKETDAG